MSGHDQKRLPAAQERPRTFGGTRRERRNGPTLEIDSGVISDEGICGLLEDWLIPMIVADLIQDRMSGAARSDPRSLTSTELL